MKHTKEPWIIDSDRRRGANLIRGDKAKMVAWTIYFDNGSKTELANAKRIVACVNACAGITNEALEAGVVRNVLGEYMQDSNHIGDVKIFYDLPLMREEV
jgi:hypothetical protein